MTKRARLLFCLALLPLTLPPALAQTPPPPDHELHRQRQAQRLQEQHQALDALRRPPALDAPAPDRPHTAQPCFPIQRIDIEGADLLDSATRAALVAAHENRCLTSDDIDALLRQITAHYLHRGHVTTRAYLPEQELGTGILRIRLLEGILENLQPAPGSPLTPREIAMTFPGRTGKILSLRDIEQMLDQLNRLPARQANVELEPGSHPGASRALVSTHPQKPWRLSLARHNDGSPDTDEHMLEAGLEWDSPLGLADQLHLRAGRGLQHNARNGFLHYSLPWGWWTAAYNFTYTDYESGFRNGDFQIDTSGWSRAHDLRLSRVLHRDATSKTTLDLALNQTETRSEIENIEIDLSSVRLTEAGLGIAHGRRIGPAYLNLELGWQRGLTLLGAERDRNLPDGAARAQYNKGTLTAAFLYPFQILSQSLRLESMAFWQHSRDILHSPRQVGLGGQGSVRGFKEQTLYGSTGGYWRSQIGWQHAVPWAWLQPLCQEAGLALAWDIGSIRRDEANRYTGQYGRLSGYALELSANGPYARVRMTWARTGKRPHAFRGDETPFWVRVELVY